VTGRNEAAEQVSKRLGAMRNARGAHGRRHPLSAVLFESLVAIVAGCNDAEGIAGFGKYYVDWVRIFSNDASHSALDEREPRVTAWLSDTRALATQES